eukprot:jgi/Tetstr1/439887/TSEL_028295.t1
MASSFLAGEDASDAGCNAGRFMPAELALPVGRGSCLDPPLEADVGSETDCSGANIPIRPHLGGPVWRRETPALTPVVEAALGAGWTTAGAGCC